ncbi:MAG: holin [Clostridia bacterium]|nr:holin [Clostridia bacterium]
MSGHQVNSSLIAKNTIFLYVRMLLIMGISFYTSRVVLNALGESDYGTYNVVGGLVVIVSFLNSAMMGTTQRYLNFELGTKNETRLHAVFWTSVKIHIWIAIIILAIAETLGLWFLNRYMNIPHDTMFAANVVYQCSVLSFLVTVVTVPHNAAIIAHEKMDVFAYISIVEALLKLASALLLLIVPSDNLIDYAIFMLVTTIVPRILIYIYSKKNFKECTYGEYKHSKELTKEIISFSGWNVFGSLGYILHTQGISIIINLFFNTIVNAAQGISVQVNTLVRSFSESFLQAIKPQVIQTYAAGELEQMHQLIFRGCRLAIFLTAFFAIPILIECESLLTLWLKIIPDYTVPFVRVVILIALIDACTPVLATAQNATGKIRTYQVTLTSIGFLHLPLAAVCFWLGYSPVSSFYVYLVLTIILQITRTLFVCKSVQLSKKEFITKIVIRSTFVLCLSALPPIMLRLYLPYSIGSSLAVLGLCVITNILTIGTIGLTKSERMAIFTVIAKKIPLKK